MSLSTPVPELMPLLWLSLGLCVLSLALALWLHRRRDHRMTDPIPSGGVRLVSQTVLSRQQRLVTIEVGAGVERCWLVLGVTAQQISVLHRLDPPTEDVGMARLEPTLPSIAGTSFGYLLAQWRRGPQGPAVNRHR